MDFKKTDYISNITTDSYFIRYRKDGIMHFHIIKADLIDLFRYKEIIEEIGRMLNYKKVPFLVSSEPFEIIGDEIRDFISSKEGAPYSIADAIISDNEGVNLLANFYIRINKPFRPTKFFKKEEEAILWLTEFI